LPNTPVWRNSVTAPAFMQLASMAVPYLPSSIADKLSTSAVK